MKNTWQFQEAKKQFGTVVENALAHGAQIVVRHGEPLVQIVPVKKPKGRRAHSKSKPKQKLSEFFSVLRGVDLDLERIKDYPRDIKL